MVFFAPFSSFSSSNLYKSELIENTVISKMETTAKDGKKYKINFYNLKAITAVGYRVNSHRATEFRKWATDVLHEYIIKGFIMDDERLKQIHHFGIDYFEEQLDRIREIRLSERRFYQKIFMGLKTWKKLPEGKILRSDVTIAKNYLNVEHIEQLKRIVSAYVDLAGDRALRGIVMNMSDWVLFLDKFLTLSDYPILLDNGKISALEAKLKAEVEYEKYRVVQDREYISDFDKLLFEIKRDELGY